MNHREKLSVSNKDGLIYHIWTGKIKWFSNNCRLDETLLFVLHFGKKSA